MHLSALNLSRDLQVTPLSFEQTVALPLSTPDRAQAIWCEASTRFLTRWIEGTPSVGPAKPSLTVRRRVTGRTVITNYDPMQLPNEERRLLHEEAQQHPRNYISHRYPTGRSRRRLSPAWISGHPKLQQDHAISGQRHCR